MHERRFLFDVELSDVGPIKKGNQPAFLGLGLDDGIYEIGFGLHSEGEAAGKDGCSQLPGIDRVIDPHDQVGIIDECQGVFDEVFVFDFVRVEHAL